MDFETNSIIAVVYDLCKEYREIIQLFFPIHVKARLILQNVSCMY